MERPTFLPVDGLGIDFRDLDEPAQRIVQYALSRKILAAVKRQEFTQAELEELYVVATSDVTANNDLQERLRAAIKTTGSPS